MTIGRILDEKLMVGVVTEIECSICKKTYFPVDSDISLNGNQYFKNCKECRKHRLELKKRYEEKKLTKSIKHNSI
jgi:hypothetical protein